jgi:hypothetical protein
MKRSTKPMSRGKAMKTRRKVRLKVSGIDYLALCRGQRCYLQIDWVCSPIETVVPCHSNQLIHGKGMGIKASDEFTVPGCMRCHAELDQGKRFNKVQKFEIWNSAHERWVPDRQKLIEQLNTKG